MTNPLATFAFADLLVRVIRINNQPWWVASDIAKILGYRDGAHMVRMLDADQKSVHLVHSGGGEAATHEMGSRPPPATHEMGSSLQRREMTIINEDGLWACIIGSNKPEAKRLRKWLTRELLPTLRRDGFYAMPGSARLENLPTPSRVRALRELTNATLSISRARSPPQRNVIYAVMQELAGKLGQPLPPLNDFFPERCVDLEAAAIIEQIDAMLASGLLENRHRRAKAGLIAVWVRDLEAVGIRLTTPQREALRRHDRCVGDAQVNTKGGKGMTCWVFRTTDPSGSDLQFQFGDKPSRPH